MLTESVDTALRAQFPGTPIDGLSIGDPNDRSTWKIRFGAGATAQQIANANAYLAALDPTSQAFIDTDITRLSQATSRQKDILASIAWAIRLKDPAAWAALTNVQRRNAVLAEADNWRDIRVFIEKNL